MALTLLLIFVAVLAAYYFLGTPLLDFIHKFTQQFTHSFPLWVLFGGVPAARMDVDGAEGRRAARKRSRRSGGSPQL